MENATKIRTGFRQKNSWLFFCDLGKIFATSAGKLLVFFLV